MCIKLIPPSETIENKVQANILGKTHCQHPSHHKLCYSLHDIHPSQPKEELNNDGQSFSPLLQYSCFLDVCSVHQLYMKQMLIQVFFEMTPIDS